MPIKCEWLSKRCDTVGSAQCAQLYPTLGGLTDRSRPGSSVRGNFQAKTLEWATISYSGRSSRPRNQTCISRVSCTGRWVLYHQRHLGSPYNGEQPIKRDKLLIHAAARNSSYSNYAERKEPDREKAGVHGTPVYHVLFTLFIQNSREHKLISNDRREMSSCLETFGEGGRETGQGGMRGKGYSMAQTLGGCMLSVSAEVTVLEVKRNVREFTQLFMLNMLSVCMSTTPQ